MTRPDGRAADELRPITITRNWLDHAAGSVLVEFGKTRVLCAASASTGVPRWRKDSGLGWVTAEYAMLPSSTHTRSDRESVKGRIGGRTHEISRLIGRSLRAVIDYKALGENTIVSSTATCCRPTAAPGPRRSPARTSRWPMPCAHLREQGALAGEPLTGSVAAVSVGIIDGEPRLDLPYEEDVRADTDMNVVMTGDGAFVEVQGTAEADPFDRAQLDALLDLAVQGLRGPDPDAAARRSAREPRGSSSPRATPRSSRSCARILSEVVPDIEVRRARRRPAYDEPAETEPTFEGNALIKARAAVRGDRPADAGRRQRHLRRRAQRDARRAVGALGRPGQGQRGQQPLLLEQLADTPDDRRGAEFRCAVAFCMPGGDGVGRVVVGEMRGRVHPRAARRGRLRLRRPVRPRRIGDDRTTAELTPTRRTRSPTAARPCARSPRWWPRCSPACEPGSGAGVDPEPRQPPVVERGVERGAGHVGDQVHPLGPGGLEGGHEQQSADATQPVCRVDGDEAEAGDLQDDRRRQRPAR